MNTLMGFSETLIHLMREGIEPVSWALEAISVPENVGQSDVLKFLSKKMTIVDKPLSLAVGVTSRNFFIAFKASYIYFEPKEIARGRANQAAPPRFYINIATRDLCGLLQSNKYCYTLRFELQNDNWIVRDDTRLRKSEKRHLLDADRIKVDSVLSSKDRSFLITIPIEELYGLDPIKEPNILFNLTVVPAPGLQPLGVVDCRRYQNSYYIPALWVPLKIT